MGGCAMVPPPTSSASAPLIDVAWPTLRARFSFPTMMTPDALKALESPQSLAPALQALWHDARGDWDEAHTCCQTAGNRDGDWVHAYLHRKEGDLGNAGYWYARAGRRMPPSSVSLATEWAQLATELLSRSVPGERGAKGS
jgi:hypothetical protein